MLISSWYNTLAHYYKLSRMCAPSCQMNAHASNTASKVHNACILHVVRCHVTMTSHS